jgi:hypothetical protein
MFGGHRDAMPIVARLAGSDASSASPTAMAAPLGGARSPGALLPSGDSVGLPPARAQHRTLALDALLVTRTLRDHPRDAGPWGEPAFAREVDLIRSQLAPIRTRRGLAASFSREAFQSAESGGPSQPGALPAVRVAYAVRWLELGDGVLRWGWTGLVTGRD